MKRMILMLALAAAPAAASEIKITMSTPASVALSAWCGHDEPCDQAVADRAQAYCAKEGRVAQLASNKHLVERSFFKGAKFTFRFNCVR